MHMDVLLAQLCTVALTNDLTMAGLHAAVEVVKIAPQHTFIVLPRSNLRPQSDDHCTSRSDRM